jgi:hypothetical protein
MIDNARYVKAYFRIEAGYVWGKGMDDEAGKRFFEEIVSFLEQIGFSTWDNWPVPRYSGSCPIGHRGAESLYCHPMDLSGYVKEEAVSEIMSILGRGTTFRLRAVDQYERVSNFTHDELREYLIAHFGEVDAIIKKKFATTRRTLYCQPVLTFSLENQVWFSDLNAVVNAFFYERVSELVKQNIIEYRLDGKFGHLYRTRSETELKEMSKGRKHGTDKQSENPLQPTLLQMASSSTDKKGA